MNAATESADSAQAVEAAEERPCLDIDGSKVYAEMQGGVLTVRILTHPADDVPVAVLVDETLVAGSEMDWKPRGRHRKPSEEQA